MSIDWSRVAGAACAMSIAAGGFGCSAASGRSKVPATAAASPAPSAQASPPAPTSDAPRLSPDDYLRPAGSPSSDPAAAGEATGDQKEAELVVSPEVVSRCPTMRVVRAHVDAFDPDMVWLAILESLAECMSADGPMSNQTVAVSGDEEHRQAVRAVLRSRGVASTRVVGFRAPASRSANDGSGAAECQAGTSCTNRVEITIVAP